MLDNENVLFAILTRELNIGKSHLYHLKTFEQNLDILCTAAKHCKKNICQFLITHFGFGQLILFYELLKSLILMKFLDPNKFSNDGSPLHWLVRNNFISYNDSQDLSTTQEKPSKV